MSSVFTKMRSRTISTGGFRDDEEKVPVYNTGSESTDCIFCPFIS